MIAGEDLALFERSLQRATSDHTGPALDAALDALGWRDALAVDGRAAVSLLFTHQGAAGASSSALDRVLGEALGVETDAVVLPAIGEWSPPGSLTDGGLHVRGMCIGAPATTCVVVAAVDGSDAGYEVELASLPQRRVDGADPSLGLVEVAGSVAGAREVGPVDWRAAVGAGQLALGHELVGASRRMLELARRHALDRIQFGQPIARFQAVRHRLAEALVAIEAAEAMLDAGWLDRTPANAAMAKAVAGRSARVVARHCQQVLAGIGFTTEHPLHRSVKRVLVLEQLLGSPAALTRQLGGDVLQRGELPPLLRL
jgi:hypothetical protein